MFAGVLVSLALVLADPAGSVLGIDGRDSAPDDEGEESDKADGREKVGGEAARPVSVELVLAAWLRAWLACIGWKRYNRQRLTPGGLRSRFVEGLVEGSRPAGEVNGSAVNGWVNGSSAAAGMGVAIR